MIRKGGVMNCPLLEFDCLACSFISRPGVFQETHSGLIKNLHHIFLAEQILLSWHFPNQIGGPEYASESFIAPPPPTRIRIQHYDLPLLLHLPDFLPCKVERLGAVRVAEPKALHSRHEAQTLQPPNFATNSFTLSSSLQLP